jgi:tRNA1(Val) A37 N6-methylase TrmN6
MSDINPADAPVAAGEALADVTRDALLGGQVRLSQPRHGYRVAIDPVFLAAAVPVVRGDRVLDVGCGVGAASLCVALREPGCRISAVEANRDLVRLAVENVAANAMTGRIDVMVGDLIRPPSRLAPGSYHHVMMNPPYLENGRATASPIHGKALANIESTARLGDWLRFALMMVRGGGTVTMIHRADRLDAVLAELYGRAGGIVVFPLWPDRTSRPAKRVLVRVVKGSATPMRLAAGLVLHEPGGGYSEAADQILRHAAALPL